MSDKRMTIEEMADIFEQASKSLDSLSSEEKKAHYDRVAERWAELAQHEAEQSKQKQIRRAQNWKQEWEILNRPFTI